MLFGLLTGHTVLKIIDFSVTEVRSLAHGGDGVYLFAIVPLVPRLEHQFAVAVSALVQALQLLGVDAAI